MLTSIVGPSQAQTRTGDGGVAVNRPHDFDEARPFQRRRAYRPVSLDPMEATISWGGTMLCLWSRELSGAPPTKQSWAGPGTTH
jgi:hypothetical protein